MGVHNRVIPGERSGSNTIIARAGGTTRRPKWLIRCDCGTERVVSGGSIRTGGACKKCGQKAQAINVRKERDPNYCRTRDRLYRCWIGMRVRCYSEKKVPAQSSHWRANNIQVCPEWRNDFAAFRRWARANGYADNLTLDRVNNAGNYEPSNCEWVTKSENSRRMSVYYLDKKRIKWTVFPIEALWGYC